MKRAFSLSALFAAIVAVSACGSSATPLPTVPSSTTVTLTFASALAVGGSSSRAFSMTTAGTVSVTLAAFGGGQTAGIGIGVPTATVGGPCALTQSVVTAPGGSPQIVTTADAGNYCVQIYDVGNLVNDTGFSITIEHP